MASVRRIAAGLVAAASLTEAFLFPDILVKDVVIIGGGGSGAHAALRLKEDFKQDIVVVEKKDHLGGHVDTYQDPVTGKWFDFGVQTWNDYGPAKDIFARLNITTGPMVRYTTTSQYVDFNTGELTNFTYPAAPAWIAALGRMYEQAVKYEDMTLPGYFNFPKGSEIPEDLLLPFSEFVKKYDLYDAMPMIFQTTGLGAGDVPNILTLYVLSAFGPEMIRGFIGLGSSFTPASGRNIEVYEKIAQRLGKDVLYSSTVYQTLRTPIGVSLYVKNAAGKSTLILARRLLVAIEPTQANLEPFDLDSTEKAIFNKMQFTTVHGALVSHPSLPRGVSLINTPAAAAPNNYLAVPAPNHNARFDHFADDNFRIIMVGKQDLTLQGAQQIVRDNFDTLVEGGIIPGPASSKDLVIKSWSDHGAMHMYVTKEDLQNNFIQKMYALQGRRATWYTGGAWGVHFQSVLWAFNDIIIPKMLK